MYKVIYHQLRIITGIAPFTAAALITEIGDMKRIASFYYLHGFIGLMPMEHSSGEKRSKAGK